MKTHASSHANARPPLGATVHPNGVQFTVWAPDAGAVEVEVYADHGPRHHLLDRDTEGLHVGFVPNLTAGATYRYRLDRGEAYPDPASRYQPDGIHGPSEVIDPAPFPWTDAAWTGLPLEELIISELHIGTATPEGTLHALAQQLPEQARLGVTAIELMPVADFAGRWNWGYDGVDWWAPSRAYGRPDDLRRLVDRAHQLGLAVILDVVYNHFGPDGAYWRRFSNDYFTEKHQTPWGEGINFDGPNSPWVREFVAQNAAHWIREYHLDGLRLDATHTIVDDSPVHILAELSERLRSAASPRQIVLIAENEHYDPRILRPIGDGGFGLDAVWADDFHHAMQVFLTGEKEGYVASYTGTSTEICDTIEHGFLAASADPSPLSTPLAPFVFCLQNHDQIGNRAFGERLPHLIDRDRFAVASALLLFAPQTPVLFMGQEFAASTPFNYFTDFDPELGALVTEGRRAEFAGFRAFDDPALRESIPDPQNERTFLGSKLDHRDREINGDIYELYRALLALRREDPVLRRSDRDAIRLDAPSARLIVVHRWHQTEHRLLVANFGAAVELSLDGLTPVPAIPTQAWRLLLSTADVRFGGSGRESIIASDNEDSKLLLPARTAVILAASAREDAAQEGMRAWEPLPEREPNSGPATPRTL